LETYDYIIAGAGAAGLSLAYHMAQTELKNASVLLLDTDAKQSNDRTWCFWASGNTVHDDIVCKKWPALYFQGDDWRRGGNMDGLDYQMIRGLDFYQKVHRVLAGCPNFEFRQERVLSYEAQSQGAIVQTDQAAYWAPTVFNSCLRPNTVKPRVSHFLLQHFTGWWIKTAEDCFKPDEGVLMDFRTPQYGSARFFYLLPLNEREALVEYTIFSPERLQPNHYEEALATYLEAQCGLTAYEITERESGAIPMTDWESPAYYCPNVVNIGTYGGAVKPTTGYAFQNIQRQAQQLVAQMQMGKTLQPKLKQKARFRFYDQLLLNILQEHGEEGKGIFSRLFRHNRMSRILHFLEERTSVLQEVRIFASLPILTFLMAVARVYLLSRLRWKKGQKTFSRSDSGSFMLPTPLTKRRKRKVI
jgi:lycopene beta-cyclase